MSTEAVSSAAQLRVDVWKVGDLLREQSVRIPAYQRPYKWEVVQPTRSAITVAGMSGVLASSCRTTGSNGVNDDGIAGR